MERFVKIVNGFRKGYILDVWHTSEYASVIVRTHLKMFISQPDTIFIGEVVFENLDKSMEYICDRVPMQQKKYTCDSLCKKGPPLLDSLVCLLYTGRI